MSSNNGKPVVNTSKPPIDAKQDEQAEATLRMQRQIEDLEKQLAAAKLANSPNELDIQNRATLLRTSSTEQRSKGPDGEPMWEEVEVFDKKGNILRTEKLELWDLKIDLAPTGAHDGSYIMCGGTQYVHGLTYRVNTHVLRSLKDIMSRGWVHDAIINGRNENEYRRQTNATIRPN